MVIRVWMLAFYDGRGKIRNVTIPDTGKCVAVTEILDDVFYKGQNEFCDKCDKDQNLANVSSGDVVEFPEGNYHLVKAMGFKKLSFYQFVSYQKHLSRDERKTILHFVNLGD